MNRLFRAPVVALLALLVNVTNAQDVRKRAVDIVESSSRDRIEMRSRLSETERLEIVAELKKMLAQPEYHKEPLRYGLAFLDDDESLRLLVGEFVANDAAGYAPLAAMQNPRVITMVAPEFYRDEPMSMGASDVIVIPVSYRAAELAVKVLAETPAFHEHTQTWAQSLRGLTFTEVRQLIRPWWKENERFFREKNYKAVRPGPPPPRDPYAEEKAVVVAPPSTLQSPNASALPSSPTPLPAERPVASSGTSWLGYAVAGALALLLAAAIFLSTRRRH
jgi:hypothetical protein